jgi:hypothetical protein
MQELYLPKYNLRLPILPNKTGSWSGWPVLFSRFLKCATMTVIAATSAGQQQLSFVKL